MIEGQEEKRKKRRALRWQQALIFIFFQGEQP